MSFGGTQGSSEKWFLIAIVFSVNYAHYFLKRKAFRFSKSIKNGTDIDTVLVKSKIESGESVVSSIHVIY